MIKSLTTGLLISISIIGTVVANDTFVIDTYTLKQEALNKAHARNIDYFNMIDIDNNGKLSKTECAGSSDGLDVIPFFSKEEMIEMKKKIDDAFDDFDIDKDGYLNRDEATPYFSFIENIGLATQTNKMDTNNDGQITDEEMQAYMQTMPSLEESVAKLQELTAKVETMNQNPEQYANKIMANTSSNINHEEFLQMDSDKNNQVTQQEYTQYMFNHPNNKELGFSEDDYNNIYNLIDSSKKGYITLQEYNDYTQKQLNDVMANVK